MALTLALVFHLAPAGLALATTLSSNLNAFLLYRRLRLEDVYRSPQGWSGLLLRAGLAAGPFSTTGSATPGSPSFRYIPPSSWPPD